MFESLPPWRLRTLLITALCGAVLYWMPQEGRPFWEILKWDDQTSFPFFLAVVFCLFLPVTSSKRHEALLEWLGSHPIIISIATSTSLAILSPWLYQAKPLSTDEYLLWFQAHSFARLELYARFPPDWLPHLFGSHTLFISNWRAGWLLSPYWPGFSLLLAPFAALGMPWLGNPVVVGVSVYVIWRIAKDIFHTSQACGLALLLTIASSAFFFNGVTFYAGPAHLLLNAIFTWLLLEPTRRRVFMAGLTGSFALVLHNPLSHFLYAAPWIVWLCCFGHQRLRNMLLFGAGYLPISLLLGVGWVLLRLSNGCSPECAAATVANSGAIPTVSTVTSFGTSAFVLPDAGILKWRIAAFAKLWFSAVPGLVALACMGAFRRQPIHIRLLAASGAATFAGYFFIPFDQGFGWGYRYFHSAWFVLPLLATAALIDISSGSRFSCSEIKLAVRASILSLLLLFPVKGFIMHRYTEAHWSQMPPHNDDRNEILFKNAVGNWGLFVAQNSPDMESTPTVFLSRGRRLDNEFVQKHFPGATLVGVNGFGTTYRVPQDLRPHSQLETLKKTGSIPKTPPLSHDDGTTASRD